MIQKVSTKRPATSNQKPPPIDRTSKMLMDAFAELDVADVPGPEALKEKLPPFLSALEAGGASPEARASAERTVNLYAEAKRALSEERWADAKQKIAEARAEFQQSESIFPKRAAGDLRGRFEGAESLADAGPEIVRRRNEPAPATDTFERVSLPKGARRPAAGAGPKTPPPQARPEEELPPLDTTPIPFAPNDGSDLSLVGKSALGYAALSRREELAAIPANAGGISGKSVNLVFRRPQNQPPNAEEIFQETIKRLGPSAVSANARYRAETGRNIGYVQVSEQDIRRSYNKDTKAFELAPAPTQGFIRAVNAYNSGGVDAVRAEAAKMAAEDTETAKKVAEIQNRERTLGDAVTAGVSEFGINTARLAGNMKTLATGIAYQEIYGTNSPEFNEVGREELRDRAAINAARDGLPVETSTTNSLVRGATTGLLTAPQYIAAARVSPAFGPGFLAMGQNIDRGRGAAYREGVTTALTFGTGRVVGDLTSGLAPVSRQVLTRGAEGFTNSGAAFASGITDPKELAKAWTLGAMMPIGKRPRAFRLDGEDGATAVPPRPRIDGDDATTPPVPPPARVDGSDGATPPPPPAHAEDGVTSSPIARASEPRAINAQTRHPGADPASNVALINQHGLQPKHTVAVDNAHYSFSDPFSIGEGRVAVMAVVDDGASQSVRVYYRSNSQGNFRLLPAQNHGLSMLGVPGFDKGGGETRLGLPAAAEARLAGLVAGGKTRTDIPESAANKILEGAVPVNRTPMEYIEYGRTDAYPGNRVTDVGIVEPRPGVTKLGRDRGPDMLPPDQVHVAEASRPDFSAQPVTYRTNTATAGDVEAMVYPSRDGKMEWTMFRDAEGRAWIANVGARGAEINDMGIRNQAIDSGDLTAPLWEYGDQIPRQYVGPRHPTLTDYHSNWSYVRELPVVQEYYRSRGMPIPR